MKISRSHKVTAGKTKQRSHHKHLTQRYDTHCVLKHTRQQTARIPQVLPANNIILYYKVSRKMDTAHCHR